jgi:transposase-like protein
MAIMARKKQQPIKTQKGQDLPELSENEAREHIERLMWPDGQPICRHCGSTNAYRMQGSTCRPGLCRCRACQKQFTVTVGTIFEDSHLPLAKWVKAFHLLATSKKGFSALQLMRNLGLGSYRTAWFMLHRVREAMRHEPLAGRLKGEVQVDECYVGGKPRPKAGEPHKRGMGTDKAPVVALVETNGGHAMSRPMGSVDSTSMGFILHASVDPSAKIVTDESNVYPLAIEKAGITGGHETVNHKVHEYVRKADGITTNTVESFHALIKRGHYGVYHKMSKKHLRRYCDEFNFRWNGRTMQDSTRRDAAISGAEGKRLTYKPIVKGN